MSKKSVVVLSLLLFMSFAISSCSTEPVPGIDAPIVVEKVDFLFYEVEFMEAFKFQSQTEVFRPAPPNNMFIAIKANTEYSDVNYPCKWSGGNKIKLEYLKDGEKEGKYWSVCVSDSTFGWVRFFFVTYEKGVTDYEIVFPGGKRVPLDGLID